MKPHQIHYSIFIFILAFSIASCSRKASAVLRDFSCQAPCWRGIEVGKTEIDQAIRLLNQVPEVKTGSIQRGINYQTWEEVVVAGFQNSKETSVKITFQEQKVVSIYFSYEEDLSLADAIEKFGEPKWIVPYALKGDPTVYLTVGFLYPDQGICLHHQNTSLILQVPKTYRIRGAINITKIYYVDPALPQGQQKLGCLRGSDENELMAMMQDWKGFAEYSLP